MPVVQNLCLALPFPDGCRSSETVRMVFAAVVMTMLPFRSSRVKALASDIQTDGLGEKRAFKINYISDNLSVTYSSEHFLSAPLPMCLL